MFNTVVEILEHRISAEIVGYDGTQIYGREVAAHEIIKEFKKLIEKVNEEIPIAGDYAEDARYNYPERSQKLLKYLGDK